MAEKLLIRRCANFVPSIHLSIGTFALKGHCVTFPQDITEMCNELPLRKEAVVVFIRYIGVGRRGTNQLRLLERYRDVLVKHTTEDPAPGCLNRRRIVRMIYFKL